MDLVTKLTLEIEFDKKKKLVSTSRVNFTLPLPLSTSKDCITLEVNELDSVNKKFKSRIYLNKDLTYSQLIQEISRYTCDFSKLCKKMI